MPTPNDKILDDLLALEASAYLQLQNIQKLRSKIDGKPKRKPKGISEMEIQKALAKRNKVYLR